MFAKPNGNIVMVVVMWGGESQIAALPGSTFNQLHTIPIVVEELDGTHGTGRTNV